jgi:peptidyl-prolyl cis-trans isomerase C
MIASGAMGQTATPAPSPAETPAPKAAAGSIPAAPAPATAAAPAAPADPVVAKVGTTDIHLSEVQAALAGVPQQYRQLPPQMLYPMVLDQVVDRYAVAALARKEGLQNDPEVQAAMQRAADNALENALVSRAVRPQVTAAAIASKYAAMYAKKPGEEEVHARHILVPTEDAAKKIIDQLNKGADFATLAKANSTDPGAAQGGDLGWFKKADMLPEFSAVAFALKPGETSQTPVHTRYGWHVIKVEGTRTTPPPTLEQATPQIRQELIQAAVQQVVEQARAGVNIEKFNPDGSVPQAAPAPAPAAPTAPPPK